MAAGRRSSSSSASGAQWGSTRTRGSSVSATVSSSYEHEHASSSTQGSPLGGATDTSASMSAARLHDADDDGNEDAHALSTSNSNPLYGESEDEYVDDDDEDEWEDLGFHTPVFRDFKFPEPLGDADDSEYAPSDTEEKDREDLLQHAAASDDEEDVSASDLEDEEEESSVAGLFASVIRQFGGATKKTRGKDTTGDPNAFTEHDKEFWATPEEKQQWVARFDAANKQFVHKYGCRIDSPAHPEAKAKLRREKKKRNVYALILFALCVAYLVQLIAISTNTVLKVQSVVDGAKNCVHGIPRAYQSVLEKLASLAPSPESEDSPSLSSQVEPTKPASRFEVTVEEVVVTVSEAETSEPTAVDDSANVVVNQVVDMDEVAVRVKEIAVEDRQPTVEATTEAETAESSSDKLAEHPDGTGEDANSVLSSVGTVDPKEEESPAESSHVAEEPEEQAADNARAAVELCSKLLHRLVRSKYDQRVKDAAIRACDAAVAISPQRSANGIEAHVLRGDLWSLVSEFEAAEKDYNAAAAFATPSTPQAQEIQKKILASRWINLFTNKSFKQLRQEVARISKTDQHSAPIRSLASDWLLVFKKKKQPFEVLTATRRWTLQRLEYVQRGTEELNAVQ